MELSHGLLDGRPRLCRHHPGLREPLPPPVDAGADGRLGRRLPAAPEDRPPAGDRDPDAAVLFASIQTLERTAHLERFGRDAFDYIVVDEFHHAAAPTYRRLIDWFRPRFLLGLTATPERTDGGDLPALCQENLAYRCDLVEGVRRDLLCRFDYYGVPDEVDYRSIPWRNARHPSLQ